MCREGCPISTNIPEAIELFRTGHKEEAGEMLYENNPLSVICSLVCDHEKQCEGHCVLGRKGAPVHFSSIENYISDAYLDHLEPEMEPKKGQRVAIIGSGPAGLFCGLLLLQPDFGSAVVVASILFFMCLAGGTRFIYLFFAMILACAGAMALAILEPYRLRRLLAFLDPFADLTDTGYHLVQSLLAIGSGGLFGVGLGQGTPEKIPAYYNDFIFAVVCEELGFIGAVLIIVLFVLFIVQGLLIAYKAENLYCTMVGIGIMAQIAWQVFCNIAVVTNTLPNTGISLPFFSSGGTSLILLLAEMGVMVNIGRNGERAAQQREQMRAQREAARAEREAELARKTIDLASARAARTEQ